MLLQVDVLVFADADFNLYDFSVFERELRFGRVVLFANRVCSDDGTCKEGYSCCSFI